MAFALALAGFALDGFAEWHEAHASRVNETVFARRPGSIAPRVPAPESRRISLRGDIFADSQSALESYLDDLRQVLADGRERLTKLDTGRFLNVVKSALTITHIAGQDPAKHVACQIEFLADDPYWYKSEASSSLSDTLGVSGTFSVTNAGKALTPPIFEAVRSAGTDQADVTITHTTSGLFLKWTGTMAVGKKLIFDCVNHRVLYDGADALNQFVPGSIDLNLVSGLNNFHYAGPGDVEISTVWHERWI